MMQAFVSGAGGFIGTALTAELGSRGAAVRTPGPGGSRALLCLSAAALARRLEGADVVYHLAGMAHSPARGADLAALLAVNRDLTVKMHRAAGDAGASAFVWLSSIKVLGDVAPIPLGHDAGYAPQGDYAESKMRAEQALLDAAGGGGTRLLIVRPPLVYGPGAKGNFARLLKACASPLPLPLAGAVGLRSMVGLHNLVDFLIHLASAADAPLVLHVRDDQEWRVTDLVRALRRIGGVPNRQFHVPSRVAKALAGPFGLAGLASSLFDPLRVDAGPTQQALGWRPPCPAEVLLSKAWRWMVSAN